MRRTKSEIAVVLGVLIGLLAVSPGVSAQSSYPMTPDPAGCQIAPRSVESVVALFTSATPIAEVEAPSSFTIPTGIPADKAAIAGVTATIEEAFACINGNAYFAFFSLLTDQALVTNFYWVGASVESDEMPEEALTPVVLPVEEQQTILSIAGIRRLSLDGRVGAFVTFIDPSSGTLEPDAMFIILTLIGDRWLIDEVFEF